MTSDSVQGYFGGGAEKRYRSGTHRARLPEETLRLVEPYLGHFGVTRVADVTGLDRIGIPVFMAIRPNSRSLAVSQGKGADRPAAKASAVMEAIELWHAERISRPVRLQSYLDLRACAVVADPWQLALIRDSLFSPTWPIPWIEGFDLMSGEAVWVPFELVHADTTVPPVPGSGCFDRGTNGLASGNTKAEAVLHALCEVIERDALALWEHRSEVERTATRIDLASAEEPAIRHLLDRFDAADVAVVAWNVTSDLGIATFRVLIFDRAVDTLLNPMGAAFGSGCHPDRDVAMSRALTEAAQSRLTGIAGSRDDLTRSVYGSAHASLAIEHYARLGARSAGGVDVGSIPSMATATTNDDIAVVLQHVRSAGPARAVVVDLSQPGPDIHVVRVIVPGLEGPTESAVYRPGARARGLVASKP